MDSKTNPNDSKPAGRPDPLPASASADTPPPSLASLAAELLQLAVIVARAGAAFSILRLRSLTAAELERQRASDVTSPSQSPSAGHGADGAPLAGAGASAGGEQNRP